MSRTRFQITHDQTGQSVGSHGQDREILEECDAFDENLAIIRHEIDERGGVLRLSDGARHHFEIRRAFVGDDVKLAVAMSGLVLDISLTRKDHFPRIGWFVGGEIPLFGAPETDGTVKQILAIARPCHFDPEFLVFLLKYHHVFVARLAECVPPDFACAFRIIFGDVE